MCTDVLVLALDEIKSAVAIVGNNHQPKSRDLFEIELDLDVSFNGFRNTKEYRNHLLARYENLKTYFSSLYPVKYTELSNGFELFNNCHFIVTEATRQLFSENKQPDLKRLEISYTATLTIEFEDEIKGRIFAFFGEQSRFLDDLEYYFSHRIKNINKSIKNNQNSGGIHYLSNSKEIRSQLNGQLKLFPTESAFTLLKWNIEKVHFVELVTALFESGCLIGIDVRLTKIELFNFLMWAFNVHVADINGTLKAAKNRKTVEAPFLTRLFNSYMSYKSKDL
ncbi:MAG: hypothetical protein CFE24_14695 [Flavobacterium sp. BFFFF2]|nr:MAG: hypothetical protein CFE24_14695 [Flavobacterium sp. BFFFF2]